jgi:hypothetical protein
MRISLRRIVSNALLVVVIGVSFGTMSSCAQPRVFLGGGFPGRPVPPVYYAPPGYFPRGQGIVPPPALFVPQQRFVPRPWGWGGGRGRGGFGWRGGRRWGC